MLMPVTVIIVSAFRLLFRSSSPDASFPRSMDCDHAKMVEDEDRPNSDDSIEIRLKGRNGIRPAQIIKWG